ncbi:MAG: helix-turn-helix domain-containing protein [Defluviitaleaceae bacterium]|nr:helix-turn-helix domain-containing protein [Defluviitaleaceae bacterium]
MKFIHRLLLLMDERKVTAYRLAKDVDISESLIRHWEKKPDIDPSAMKVLKISQYFQVSMEWILTGEGTKDALTPDCTDEPENDNADGAQLFDESILLQNYRRMTKAQRYKIIALSLRMLPDEDLNDIDELAKKIMSCHSNDMYNAELGAEQMIQNKPPETPMSNIANAG